jgi:L-ascorbate metabolism protein UlaG (beta-lactamase superfamily)
MAGRALRWAWVAWFALGVGTAASAADAPVEIRWLGVAGFSISAGDTVILHDPYLSRPGMLETLFSFYEPDGELIEQLSAPDGPAPELGRASVILIGHSHFDHLADAPWFATQPDGPFIAGSPTTVNVCVGYGVPADRARVVNPNQVFDIGPFRVRAIESRHAQTFRGGSPPEGVVDEPPDAPIHAWSFKLGDARAWLVTHRESGYRVMLLSSAGRHQPSLEMLAAEGIEVDVLLTASIAADEQFAADLVRTLRPKLVVPHHFESFFVPVREPGAGAPLDEEALAAFEAQLRAAGEAEGLSFAVRRPRMLELLELGE